MNLQVLYEDNHLIAVLKPTGVLSQGDRTGDVSIFDEVKKYLKEKYKKPGKVFLGLVHRLDRPVSGIILFAKTSKGAARLSEQFRNREVEKTYHAIVGPPPMAGSRQGREKPLKSRGVLINNLIKDEKLKKALIHPAPQGKLQKYFDGKEARLYYEVVKSSDNYSLLKIKLETGKFHQIRSQLSLAGFPILGDVKYGHSSHKASEWQTQNSIALCATGLSFYCATEHPAGKTLSSNGASKKINL